MSSFSKMYRIAISSWEKTSQQKRLECASQLKMNLTDSEVFCDLYFSKYAILHEMGHLIRRFLSLEGDYNQQGADEEWFADLFAVKYLQHRKDQAYLDELDLWLDRLLVKHNVSMTYDRIKMNRQYNTICLDIRTHAAMTFLTIKEALNARGSINDALSLVSEGKISRVNQSIFCLPDIDSSTLISESLQNVFSFHPDIPEVGLQYSDSIGVHRLIDSQ